jgi:short-subunit dehydrogenase
MKNNVALITGASSGLGAVFARQLASQGYDLVLVARRAERLADLAAELQQHYPISVEILAADLARPADVERVESHVTGIEGLDMLVNNAGFGTTGRFAEVDLAKSMDMIEVHIIASMRLCRAALPGMLARRRGSLINVASVAAFTPMPGNANYAATKAYLLTFSKALHAELRGTGVKVQALCPGFTYTGFHDTSEFEGFKRSQIPAILWMTAEDVVAASLKSLKRNQAVCIPGLRYRLLVAVAGGPLMSLMLPIWAIMRKRTPSGSGLAGE